MTNTVGSYYTERKGDVVAWEDGAGGWAAHKPNAATRRRGWSDETIIAFGTKISYAEAREMFPVWDATRTWRK